MKACANLFCLLQYLNGWKKDFMLRKMGLINFDNMVNRLVKLGKEKPVDGKMRLA
jgi:hypothetical protein